MGEIADMMLDGTMCEQCGEWLGDPMSEPQGFPGLCPSCASRDVEPRKTHKQKKKRAAGKPDISAAE